MLLLLLLLCTDTVLAEKFLLVSMDQGRSHTGSFAPFMHRLQKHNHTVSLYFNTYKQEIDFGMKNELIDLSEIANSPFGNGSAFFNVVWKMEFSFLHQIAAFFSQSKSCKVVLEKRRREFDRLARGNWDLVFSDSLFSVCGYGIAHLNGGHHVMIHSSDVESAQGTAKAFHRNYGILPPNFMSYSYGWQSPQFFLDRLKSTIDWFGSILVTNIISDQFMREALSPVIQGFSFAEFSRTSTFSFTDMPEILYPPAPRTNDYHSYGSYCKQSKKLPDKIDDFISDPESLGTIVVAFGTLVPWFAAPMDKLQVFVDTFNNLTDYRVIWSYNGNPIEVRSHIMLSEWIPQNDLLHHNKTVLIISHGGLKSVKEAACSGTPSLFMPMFAEQMRNSWLAKTKGYAEILNKFILSQNYIEEKIRTVLADSKYRINGNSLREKILDRPLNSLEHATFIVNRLVKYGGKFPNYFYPRSLDHNYLSILNLDILFALICMVLLLSF